MLKLVYSILFSLAVLTGVNLQASDEVTDPVIDYPAFEEFQTIISKPVNDFVLNKEPLETEYRFTGGADFKLLFFKNKHKYVYFHYDSLRQAFFLTVSDKQGLRTRVRTLDSLPPRVAELMQRGLFEHTLSSHMGVIVWKINGQSLLSDVAEITPADIRESVNTVAHRDSQMTISEESEESGS